MGLCTMVDDALVRDQVESMYLMSGMLVYRYFVVEYLSSIKITVLFV